MSKICKIFALLLVISLLFVSCGEKISPIDINVAVIKGPTGVGMSFLMEKNSQDAANNHYTFTIASGPDEVVPKIVTGEVDIAAVPTNLASTLYKKTEGGVKILAVNTLGVLHVLEKGDSVSSIADLKGKTVYMTGEGSNPDYIFRKLLTENGLVAGTDVKIVYIGTNDELLSAIISGEAEIALAPEPFATTVLAKVEGLRRALDVTAEWDKLGLDCSVMMGCVIVRKDFLENNEDAVKNFLNEYEDSIKSCSNAAEAAALCEKYEIIPSAAVAEKAIPNCNLTYVAGKEMKEKLSKYFEILFEISPTSVGGELPDDNFYYLG